MIDRIDGIDSLTAKHISTRKPCIITAIPEELSSLSDFCDLQHLSDLAGDAIVTAEPISEKGTFGTGAIIEEMPFAAFLKTFRIRKAFPKCPSFVSLVPAKINLWLGASKTGTSSGYTMIFMIIYTSCFPVARHSVSFPLHGRIVRSCRFENDRMRFSRTALISYGNLCADGMKTPTKAQIRVSIRERALEMARTLDSNVEEAEARYEAAMDYLLDSTLENQDEEEDGSFDEDTENITGDESSESDEEPSSLETPSKTAKTPDLSPRTEYCVTHAEDEPPSFSNLSSDEVKDMLNEQTNGQEFVLEAGQMLYLPASYLHEVISMSGAHDFHMAVNYWFYPPDEDGAYSDKEIMDELYRRATQSTSAGPPRSKRVKI
ncbi:hypothetical protein MRB53_039142 [Persea americana]|nr:hypothetical protein MRB53_039142 [Persea americana]